MIRDIKIKNYRGVSDGEINGLRQLSVITGANNSAKTTVLEAMALATAARVGPHDDEALLGAVIGHRALGGDVRTSLLRDQGTHAFIGTRDAESAESRCWLVGENNHLALRDENTHVAYIGSKPKGFTHYRDRNLSFVAAPMAATEGALEESISGAERLGYRRQLLEAAKQVDSTINDLRILMLNGVPTLFAESVADGSERLTTWPIAVGGTGFKRYLTLVAQTVGSAGLVCLDDPDAFLHPGMFKHLAQMLWNLVESGAQVVVATHSLDLIEELARPINGDPLAPKFGVFGFERSPNGQLACTMRLPGASAQLARKRDDLRQALRM